MKWSEVLQAIKSLIFIFSILTAFFKLDKIINALGKFIERICLIPRRIERKRLENERIKLENERYRYFSRCLPKLLNDPSLSPNMKEELLRFMAQDSMQLQKEDPHKQPHTLPPERDDNSDEEEETHIVPFGKFRKKK